MKKQILAMLLVSVMMMAGSLSVSGEETQGTFTPSSGVVNARGNIAITMGNPIHIYDGSGNQKEIIDLLENDRHTEYTVMTDDHFYYGDGYHLYDINLSDFSVTALYPDLYLYAAQPYGMIGDELYFTYRINMDDEETVTLAKTNLKTGEGGDVGVLDRTCMHSVYKFHKNEIYYSQGVGDVSTYALLQYFEEDKSTKVIAEEIGAWEIHGDVMVYLKSDKEASRQETDYHVIKRDLNSGAETELCQGPYEEIGYLIVGMDDQNVYLQSYSMDGDCIYMISLETGEKILLAKGNNVRYAGVKDGQAYYTEKTDSELLIQAVDIETGDRSKIASTYSEDQLSGMSENAIYLRSLVDGGWNNYVISLPDNQQTGSDLPAALPEAAAAENQTAGLPEAAPSEAVPSEAAPAEPVQTAPAQRRNVVGFYSGDLNGTTYDLTVQSQNGNEIVVDMSMYNMRMAQDISTTTTYLDENDSTTFTTQVYGAQASGQSMEYTLNFDDNGVYLDRGGAYGGYLTKR